MHSVYAQDLNNVKFIESQLGNDDAYFKNFFMT